MSKTFNKVKDYKSYNLKGIYYIDYNNFNNLLAQIEKQLVRKFVFTIKHRDIEKEFSDYFKI